MLDSRLKAAADFVRKGSIAADIGTDHGYLPIYLIENEISPLVIASDIRKGPISCAERNARNAGFSHKISCRLGPGLESLAPFEASDIIIAGMGGELISQILSQCSWVKSEKINLVLQPMTKPEALRRYLNQNCFQILGETAVRHKGRLYTVINAAYHPLTEQLDESAFYIGGLNGKDSENAGEYLLRQAERIKKKLKGTEASGTPNARLQKILTDILAAAERGK